jgi:hypothetical protein
VLPATLINSAMLNDNNFTGAIGVADAPFWFGTPTSVTQDWYTTYKKQFPNDVIVGYATKGWQGGVVLAAALKNAPDTVTSQTVLDGLYALPANDTFGGWTPPITFSPGKSTTPSSCLWRVGIANHQLTAPKGNDPVCP